MSGRDEISRFWKAEVEPKLASCDPLSILPEWPWHEKRGSTLRGPCPLHGGDNPEAFHLWIGDRGTWGGYCHTQKCKGDLAQIYSAMHGCGFVEAVGDLALAVGVGLPDRLTRKLEKIRGSRPVSPKRAEPIEPRAPRAPTLPMPEEDQCRAVGRFLELVFEAEYPAAETAARDYLCKVRGLAPDAIARMGGAFLVNGSPDSAGSLRDALRSEPEEMRDLLVRAGLARRTDSGLIVPLWHSRAVLLPCARPTYEDRGEIGATDYLFCTARILEPTDKRKYISQATGGGARRPLYGLPSLHRAAELRKPVLIVEGPLDAIGAETLGLHAVATHGRPEARDHADTQSAIVNSIRARSIMPLFEKAAEVWIVPDNDPGEAGETGERMATGLAAALRAAGLLSVHVRRIGDVIEGGEAFKDLAEAAQKGARRR